MCGKIRRDGGSIHMDDYVCLLRLSDPRLQRLCDLSLKLRVLWGNKEPDPDIINLMNRQAAAIVRDAIDLMPVLQAVTSAAQAVQRRQQSHQNHHQISNAD